MISNPEMHLMKFGKKEAWVLDLDVLPYEEATFLQEKLAAQRLQGKIRDILILLEHPPVITVTSKKTMKNILVPLEKLQDENILIYKTNRGGDITYHGPGQIVCYLIIDLTNHGKDIHKYVYNIEEILINLLRDYKVAASRDAAYPGVWVNNEKIAAIGIAVKRGWIAMHGFSLNVDPNFEHFSFIIPCGIKNKGVTSLVKVIGEAVNKHELRRRLIHHIGDVFNISTKQISLENII